MKRMKKFFWLVLCGMVAMNALAQRAIISRASVEKRATIAREMPLGPGKEEAVQFANQFSIPVREIDINGRIKEIHRIENNTPLYYGTQNLNAARTVSTNRIWDGSIDGMKLRGKNILVGLWDGGMIRTTHAEFGSRAYSMDSGFEIVGHATHVAGTIGATGLEPGAVGMANQCYIEGYDWDNDNGEMRQAAKDGLLLSNHSYGFIHGFDYNSTERRWEWFGDTDISEVEDYKFGFYGSDARAWDDIAYDNPHYLIVKSVGNDRLEGPVSGGEHYVFDNGWKVSNMVRNKDGGPDGFDCIGTEGTAKNILTVGAVEDIVDGYRVPEDVVMTYFSAFGPTDDGRIKPDLVGNGTNLYSSYYQNDNDYNSLSGTSMATPNVAGSLALLQELHFRRFKRYMKSSTLKGLVLHTADDAGNAGPDYTFGWGLLNTFTAAKFISNDALILVEDSITDHRDRRYKLYAPGDSLLKVTICWTDPQGPLLAPSLDPGDLALVNDLDIRLVKGSDSSIYEPYILDPVHPGDPAITGDNFRDNIEQIFLPGPEAGFYDLVVSHKNDLSDSIQHFSLIFQGAGQVYVAGDSTYLDASNGFLQVTDAPEYPPDSRFVWLIEPLNQEKVSFNFTAFETDINDVVTLYDGRDSTSPVIGTLSGVLTYPDTLFTSTGGALFITFKSGNQGSYKGFSARYCTEPPREEIEIFGEMNPCYQSLESYFFTDRPETDYLWTLSDNAIDSSILQGNRVFIHIPEDQFNLTVTPGNRCGEGDPSSRNIIPEIAPPVISQGMEGDTVPCTNTPTLFSVAHDPGAFYRWALPAGWLGRGDSSSIWVTPVGEPGTVSVFPANSCGESEAIELMVYPLPLPVKPVIECERFTPCEESVQDFYIQAEEEADYRWNVENGWEIIGPDSLDRVTVSIGSGTSGRMFITSSNQCGEVQNSRNFLLSPSPALPDLVLEPSSYEGLKEIRIRNYSLFAEVNWFRNDSIIPGFNGQTLIVHRNGTYSVDVTTEEGCLGTTHEADRVKVSEESLRFSIFTGSDGVIQIENDTGNPAVIQAFDLTGRTVFSGGLQPGTNIYRTTRRGLLILRVEGGSQVKTEMVFLY